MKKTFMGLRLKRLREERQMTQVALAQALGLSPSYLNQLEQNQRPLTVSVLLRLNAAFGIDVQLFSEDDEARLISELRDLFADAPNDDAPGLAEIRELASRLPGVARLLLQQSRQLHEAREREAIWASRLGLDRQAETLPRPMPFEAVRDFFYRRHNHIAELDELAEGCFADWQLRPGDTGNGLARRLSERHGILVSTDDNDRGLLRDFDEKARRLRLSASLSSGQQAFHMATQLARLEAGELIDELAAGAAPDDEETRRLARIGLASYFAGALLLPYGRYLESAEACRYDIEQLGRSYGVGYETACHRLSTLQRPQAPGVPFFFIRVDRAGNISKRQSATDFHFSRIGGTCPLWNVYEAFAQPGRILTQLAAMPDGRNYLWIARSVHRGHGGYGAPGKTFSIGLGCDLRHAERLVYSKGLDLKAVDGFTPIGTACKVCPRAHCPQRAFPPSGNALVVDENRRHFSPYA